MGRRRRDGNHSLQKNNSIQNSVGNEENGYLVLVHNKTTINITNGNSVMPTQKKKTLKEEISEKFMEKISDMVDQNVQDALKKFQDTKTKRTRDDNKTNKGT
jgi:hypothetical protein